MRWIYVFCILAAGSIAEDSLERVRRAPGKRCPRIQNFPGKVRYKRRGTRAQFRCYKTFNRYGPRFLTCRSDNTWSGEPPLCIKAGCVPIDIQHLTKLDMTESHGGALLSFTCEDKYQLIGPTEISCDSKVWSATPPVCKAPIQLKECDFEFDLCGWTQDDSDELDWERTQGQTSTGGTGPKIDHTFKDLSGHYMFVESSNPARNGDQARLLSPVYPADMGHMCFEFWYHILGPDDPGHVGTLEVYVRGDSEFIDDLQPLFIKSGNQGDVWKRGDIYIDKRDEPFQIVIVTTRKLSYISDIAIDDVRLYNCSGSTTSTTTTSTTTATTTPSSTSTSTTSSTVTSASLSTSIPTGLPQSATTSTIANVSSTTSTSSTGTTSLLTTLIISPSSTVTVSTPPKSSLSETTTAPVRSVSGNTTSEITTITTSKYSSKVTPPTSPSPSTIAKSSTSAAASSVTTTTGKSSTRSQSPVPISTSLGASSVTTSSTPADKVTTSISVPIQTKTVSKFSSTTATQLPVTSSTATASSSTPASSQSSSTPKPSRTSTLTTSTIKTVKPTTFRIASSTTTTKRPTSTSTKKTSTTSSRVQTMTSLTTPRPTPTTSIKISSTVATLAKTSTKGKTSQITTSTTSKSTSGSPSTVTKLKKTSATTAKSSSAKPTTKLTKRTVTTQKQNTTDARLNKTVAITSSTPLVKDKTVSTESKLTTVESNDTEPVVVAQPRSQHPADDTLRPLMIGLGVGIVAGLIIIGVVAWVCVRRRKFYTSRYEDELKPITKSSSNENFNNIQYEYHDDEEYQ